MGSGAGHGAWFVAGFSNQLWTAIGVSHQHTRYAMREAITLGPMPSGLVMETTDQMLTPAPARVVFDVVRRVEEWPVHLPHYRFVRVRERARDGGGIVEMSANRPFGAVNWPTWWLSEMAVDDTRPAIRFHHVGGITQGMDVEWRFEEGPRGTLVSVVHVWNGPGWPIIRKLAAKSVIGPVFIHGIASRTLAGLARVAERQMQAGAAL